MHMINARNVNRIEQWLVLGLNDHGIVVRFRELKAIFRDVQTVSEASSPMGNGRSLPRAGEKWRAWSWQLILRVRTSSSIICSPVSLHEVRRDNFAFTGQCDFSFGFDNFFNVFRRASRKKNRPVSRFLPTYKTHTRTPKTHISRFSSGLKKQNPRFLAVENSKQLRQRGDCSRRKLCFFCVI